jgi:hypothetical protein
LFTELEFLFPFDRPGAKNGMQSNVTNVICSCTTPTVDLRATFWNFHLCAQIFQRMVIVRKYFSSWAFIQNENDASAC